MSDRICMGGRDVISYVVYLIARKLKEDAHNMKQRPYRPHRGWLVMKIVLDRRTIGCP